MSPLQQFQEQVSKIPGPIGWALALLFALLSWVSEVTQHGFTAWTRVGIGSTGLELYLPTFSQITASGFAAGILAITAALVVAGGQISKLIIQHKKDMDAALKDSLSVKLDDLNANAERLRASLHEARNESAAQAARSHLEIERLMHQIKNLQDDNDRLRARILTATGGGDDSSQF